MKSSENPLVIRPATVSDLAEIAKIEADSYHPHLITSHEGFRIFLKDGTPDDFLIVAARADRVLGFVCFSTNRPDVGVLTIWDIAVAVGDRNQRVASALLDYILGDFDRRSCSVISLHVAVDNPAAIQLYARRGFERQDFLEAYYLNQVDGWSMVKRL